MHDAEKNVLSIVIPTLGRRDEVSCLLKSIVDSEIDFTYEVIIVDQNDDGKLDDIVEAYKTQLPIMHYHVCFRGASKARNYGVAKAKGMYVCFPDDDAEFRGDTINKALETLHNTAADVVFGKCIDKQRGTDSVTKFREKSMQLSLEDFEGAFVEATMFSKHEVLVAEPYDEELGVGCLFGSQEAYDLVYRLLKANYVLFYDPEIVFYHPDKVLLRETDAEIKRAFYYSCGFGRLCKKHGFKDKYLKRKLFLSGVVLTSSIIRPKQKRYYKAQLLGISLGYELP